MNSNLKALKAACEQKGVLFSSTHHVSGNMVHVEKDGFKHVFVNWGTPLNPQSVMQLCTDKDFFQSFYGDVIRMPRTRAYVSPFTNEAFQKYVTFCKVEDIVSDVIAAFDFPVVVKQNSGSWGSNVFRVEEREALDRAINTVFDLKSAHYDYVCLVQDCIEIVQEYRVIFLEGKLQFAYLKDISEAVFEGNLSPLHWSGAGVEIVKDTIVLDVLEQFCQSLFQKMMIPYCGLDIVSDPQGRFWLIEANASPGFDHFIGHCGDSLVVDLYKQILDML